MKKMKNDIRMKIIRYAAHAFALLALCGLPGCDKYLDVVPEGVSRLENAFSMRIQAKKYLYTCYSYMMRNGHPALDPAILGGDECWLIESEQNIWFSFDGAKIARGQQNATNPLLGYWSQYYQAIRDCNIFLENVGTVPDLPVWERNQWIAEAKFLKAWYHFCLLQMYGPVPIIRENLPIGAGVDEVRVVREPVDACFDYIVRLIDDAAPALPPDITNKTEELGRITQAIALSVKAKVLVTAASSLFNGNTQQATLHNHGDDAPLFNQTYMPEKWTAALDACEKAIQACDEAGIKLYEYPGHARYDLTDTIMTQMSLRNAFNEKWNEEIIWANTQSSIETVNAAAAFTTIDPSIRQQSDVRGVYGVPLKMVEMFYSHNGVPIEEDHTLPWRYDQRYNLRTAATPENLYVKTGEVTVNMHFEREPRFYAWIGFDEGIWYGHGKYDDTGDLFYTDFKMGGLGGNGMIGAGPVTAYLPKKYIHFENHQITGTNYSIVWAPWPLFRLSDLYLLYAEALNEAANTEKNREDAMVYIDRVRARAGLKGVKYCWDAYTGNTKYATQDGLRSIIRQERGIELCFEGQRFWDIRRWTIAPDLYGKIEGWDWKQSQPAYFYRVQTLFTQQFGLKDYFWPINSSYITVNNKLVQNIGW
jgi:hypothetical protein